MLHILPALLAALLLTPGAAAAETPAEYREALAETVRAAEEALSTLPPNLSLAEHPPLESTLLRLESIDRVSTDTGIAVTVDNRALIKLLRGSRDEARRGHDALLQLLRALESSLEEPNWTREVDARSALERVLEQREFQGTPGNPISQALEDFKARLFRWMEDLSSGIRGLFPNISIPFVPEALAGATVRVAVLLLAGALVVFTIVFLVYTWRTSGRNLARYAAVDMGRAPHQADARGALLAAQGAADKRDYHRAIHYLYLWAVLHLTERSRTRYDSSLTNREQLLALGIGGEVGELMNLAVDAFDRIWYGHAACTAIEYTQFRETVERVVGAPA